MIHSLAGGKLRTGKIIDCVKLEFEEIPNQYFWYISEIRDLKNGDNVLAPFGLIDELKKAKVIRIDKNVSSTSSPMPIKKMKYVFKKI